MIKFSAQISMITHEGGSWYFCSYMNTSVLTHKTRLMVLETLAPVP